jgi:aspartyl-tRNA(Asn)/glutamyl-tRNA(Gln) amidotransferase subunit C
MKKQSITDADVSKLAKLSKLNIQADEVQTYAHQLSDILDYMSQLEKVNTHNVEPLLNVLDEVNTLREDKPKPSITQQKALENAPQKSQGFFKVPEVIKKNG